MIPSHWLGYRRIDDGELLGYVVPTDGALFTPVTVFGYPLAPAGARDDAERRLDEVGLDYLADRWILQVADQPEVISVEIVEANPETLTVKNVTSEVAWTTGTVSPWRFRSRPGCATPEPGSGSATGTASAGAARGVRVQFVKEQLTFTGVDTAMATLLLSVMGAFAEFERSLIRERQREGIALARQRGGTRALDAEQVAQLRKRVADGIPKATLAREFGVSRETVYQYLRAGPGAERTG